MINAKTAKMFRKYAKEKAPHDPKGAYKQLKKEYEEYMRETK